LLIYSAPYFSLGGDTDQFSMESGSVPFSLAPGEYTNFNITFSPTIEGLKIATVQISNDDPDETPYTFTVNGTGVNKSVPDIDVMQNSTNYENGSNYNFGDVPVGFSMSVMFTIKNTGTADLSIVNIMTIKGNTKDFELDLSETLFIIPPSDSTYFIVTFSPSNYGNRYTELNIMSNDSDEIPYKIRFEGNGM